MEAIILEGREYEVRKGDDSFNFECQQCINCCTKTQVKLFPYDIIRLCNKLGIKTREFHKNFTRFVKDENGMPYCLLKTNPVCIMNDKRKGGKGDCRVYEDRPFLCRAFPVGIDKGKYFLKTSNCKGIGKGREWKVEEYLKEQTREYYEISKQWMDFLRKFKEENKEISKEKMLDFIKICYDFDNSFMKTFAEQHKLEIKTPEDKFNAILKAASLNI